MFDLKEYESKRCEIRKEQRRLARPIVKCPECGEEFVRTHGRVICGSPECVKSRALKNEELRNQDPLYVESNKSKARINSRAAYWSQSDDERASKIAKQCAQQKRETADKWASGGYTTTKPCAWCKQDFTAPNNRFDYCEKCRYESANETHNEKKNRHEYAERIRTMWRKTRKTEKYRHRRNDFLKIKNRTNPVFKLRGLVSKSIGSALKRTGNRKNGSVRKHLAYTIVQLKEHLESFFNNTNGFTWENHGSVWHVDHVIPHSLFPYTSMDSKIFRDCWALTNLRPMAISENYSKGARRVGYFDAKNQGAFLA